MPSSILLTSSDTTQRILIQPGTETKTLNFASARWDSFIWDAFFWDGETLSPANLKLRGSAEKYIDHHTRRF